ncbi:hypothetical protein DV738_g310, partial [Chaetothyriales sp. CBS 135597]
MTLLSRLQSLALAGFLLSFLPLSVAALYFNYVFLALDLRLSLRGRLRRNQGFQRHNVLITGVETPHGLHLARAFYSTGHNVTGVAARHGLLPSHARFSAKLSRFYQLKHALVDESATESTKEILRIVQHENIDLWIDCSQPRHSSYLRHAKAVVERRSRCLVFFPSDKHTDIFASPDAFLDYAHSCGLPSLDSFRVGSRAEIHNVLNTSQGKKRYKLTAPDGTGIKPVLPRRTLSQTYHVISKAKVQKDTPWQLKQYVGGQERYTTVGIVARGHLKAFAASPLPAPKHLRPLPPRSATIKALRSYVEALCRSLGDDFTGHIIIDFVTDEASSLTGVEKLHFSVDGRLEPDASLLLFQGLQGYSVLTRAYLATVASVSNSTVSERTSHHEEDDNTITNTNEDPINVGTSRVIYSLGYDFSQLAILPVQKFLGFQIGLIQLFTRLAALASHFLVGQEYVYLFSDPLPFWWLYQVYLPCTLVQSALQLGSQRNASRLQALMT